MNLSAKAFVDKFGWVEAERVATAAGTNRAYFAQLAGGHRNASYTLAVKLVEASGQRLSLTSLLDTSGRRVSGSAA